MSFLLGYYTELLASTVLLVPSEDRKVVDGIEISGGSAFGACGRRRPFRCSVSSPGRRTKWAGPARADRFRSRGTHSSNLLSGVLHQPHAPVEVLGRGEHDGRPARQRARRGCNGLRVGVSPAQWRAARAGRARRSAARAYSQDADTARRARSLSRRGDLSERDAVHLVGVAGCAPLRASARKGRDRYYAQVELDAEFEPLVGTRKTFAVPGMPDQDRLVRDVLERAGHGATRFRGWRCTINYPVPLLDMYVWLKHAAGAI